MKKYLALVAIAALAGCGVSTKSAAPVGTVEDRRTPITASYIPPVTTAPTEYADLGEASEADTLYLADLLTDVAYAMEDVSTATTVAEMVAVCDVALDAVVAAQVEVETYTGPKADALHAALYEWGVGFAACFQGNFELGAEYLARGNVLFDKVPPLG